MSQDDNPMQLTDDDGSVETEGAGLAEGGTTILPEHSQAPFPGRETQVKALTSFLVPKATVSPPLIFVSGLPGTGKTVVTRSVLDDAIASNHRVAWLDCADRFNPRLLLESALSQLSGSPPTPLTADPAGPWTTQTRCDTLADFCAHLDVLLEPTHRGSAQRKMFLVFDHAEKLRDMGQSLLPSLIRLSRLSHHPVTVILISTLVWEDMLPHAQQDSPTTVVFPPYTREQMLTIIDRDRPDGEPQDFFEAFVNMIYDVFHKANRDLKELRHLAFLLFPKYMEPVAEGKATRDQKSKLFGLVQPHIKDALHGLYLREISTSEWKRRNEKTGNAMGTGEVKPGVVAGRRIAPLTSGASIVMDLPYYTKFLVIAAFLASYNPPRLDVRFFAKDRSDEVSKRKGGKGRAGKVGKEGGKMRQQLLGPKTFPVERMLAIFYSILPDTIEGSSDIQMQIASLMTLGLLVRVTPPDRLDGVKCRCNARYELVKGVGRAVRFDVAQYLHDFV
ncbi:Origin recognition complex subunit 5 [Thoreauomyces humboldtii]|nr:Origin recognition complex subunit 5 [Thoreauomyces humboldtii]